MQIAAKVRNIVSQLPKDRLDCDSRDSIAEALKAGDDTRLLATVRHALLDLIQQGHLIRVDVQGGSGPRGQLLLVSGTSSLIDVGVVRLPNGVAREAEEVVGAPLPEAIDRGVDEISEMIDAMEQAQSLAVGDPRADEPAVAVDRILNLLHGYVPSVSLNAQLHEMSHVGELGPHMLQPLGGDERPFWLLHRQPGQSLWIQDVTELPVELQRRLEGRYAASPLTAVRPLFSPEGDEVEIGLLFVSVSPDWRTDTLLRLAQRLSVFVSRRWRCQREVNRRVLTDSLTGIHNRAFFDTLFPLEIERARRDETPLTLVIGDLDRFKRINDTYGHHCGDLVLRTVAQELLGALRRIDAVCRIGGEEFACILPNTSAVEAREVLGRLAGRPFRVALLPELGVGMLEVTMSYGTVTFPDAGKSPSELHRKADSLLYHAKELGRNRCYIWTPDGPLDLRQPDQSS